MSHLHNISGPLGLGQPPVDRMFSGIVLHTLAISWKYEFQRCGLRGWAQWPVGSASLVYIPKWMRFPRSLDLCHCSESSLPRILRRRLIWSLTSAFIG